MILRTAFWLLHAYGILLAAGVSIVLCMLIAPLLARVVGHGALAAVRAAGFVTAWAITWIFTTVISLLALRALGLVADSATSVPMLFVVMFGVTPLIAYLAVRRGFRTLTNRIHPRTES